MRELESCEERLVRDHIDLKRYIAEAEKCLEAGLHEPGGFAYTNMTRDIHTGWIKRQMLSMDIACQVRAFELNLPGFPEES